MSLPPTIDNKKKYIIAKYGKIEVMFRLNDQDTCGIDISAEDMEDRDMWKRTINLNEILEISQHMVTEIQSFFIAMDQLISKKIKGSINIDRKEDNIVIKFYIVCQLRSYKFDIELNKISQTDINKIKKIIYDLRTNYDNFKNSIIKIQKAIGYGENDDNDNFEDLISIKNSLNDNIQIILNEKKLIDEKFDLVDKNILNLTNKMITIEATNINLHNKIIALEKSIETLEIKNANTVAMFNNKITKQ
jgi:hypothetical protein